MNLKSSRFCNQYRIKVHDSKILERTNKHKPVLDLMKESNFLQKGCFPYKHNFLQICFLNIIREIFNFLSINWKKLKNYNLFNGNLHFFKLVSKKPCKQKQISLTLTVIRLLIVAIQRTVPDKQQVSPSLDKILTQRHPVKIKLSHTQKL